MEQNQRTLLRHGSIYAEKPLQPFDGYRQRSNSEGYAVDPKNPNWVAPEDMGQTSFGEIGIGSLHLLGGHRQMTQEPTHPKTKGNNASNSNPRKKLQPQMSWCPEDLGPYILDSY